MPNELDTIQQLRAERARLRELAQAYKSLDDALGAHFETCDECDGILVFCSEGSRLEERRDSANEALTLAALRS